MNTCESGNRYEWTCWVINCGGQVAKHLPTAGLDSHERIPNGETHVHTQKGKAKLSHVAKSIHHSSAIP